MGALTAQEARRAVPVLVLTGFLGSGKTSVLNHLLSGGAEDGRGLRIAAVVNDFGEIEVDALQVAGRVDSLVSLANGCLCCEVDASELSDALESLAAPEHRLDLVVVEASGLAEPAVLSRMVHDAPRESVSYAGTVQVVDADVFEETLGVHPRLSAHLTEADLIVVNKCDLVGREGFARVRDVVCTHAPRVAVVPAVRGAVPSGLLLGLESTVPGTGHDDGGDHHDHLHDGYSTVTAVPAGTLHPRRMLEALSAPPGGTFRAKGWVTVACAEGPRRYRVALVGRRLELEAETAGGPEVPDGLVLVGVDLDPSAGEFLDGCVVGPAEVVDPDAGLGLQPYLVAAADASDVEEWIYDEQRAAPLTGEARMLADPEDPDAGDPAFTP